MLTLRPAGALVRALAWVVDFSIRIAVWLALGIGLVTSLQELGLGLFFISAFLLEWFYPVLFEQYAQGATPGKRLFGLIVVHDDGTPVQLSASVVRNLLRAADFLPAFYGLGIVCILYRRDFKRLGDLAAGTLVVYRSTAAKPLPLPAVPPHPPVVALRLDEQRALLEFAERSPRLTPARLQELAALLPQLGGSATPAGVEQLLGQARHLAGER